MHSTRGNAIDNRVEWVADRDKRAQKSNQRIPRILRNRMSANTPRVGGLGAEGKAFAAPGKARRVPREKKRQSFPIQSSLAQTPAAPPLRQSQPAPGSRLIYRFCFLTFGLYFCFSPCPSFPFKRDLRVHHPPSISPLEILEIVCDCRNTI